MSKSWQPLSTISVQIRRFSSFIHGSSKLGHVFVTGITVGVAEDGGFGSGVSGEGRGGLEGGLGVGNASDGGLGVGDESTTGMLMHMLPSSRRNLQ